MNDLFVDYGSPMEIVEKHIQKAFVQRAYLRYCYIIIIFIIISRHMVINLLMLLVNALNYHHDLSCNYYGKSGLLGHAMNLLSKKNTEEFSNLFSKLGFNIIHSEALLNEEHQKKFFDVVPPNILAVSQYNPWSYKLYEKYLYMIAEKYLKKIKKIILNYIRMIYPSYKVSCDIWGQLQYHEYLLNEILRKI